MPLTPTQLKTLCQQYHLTPSKKYGQNYLISDAPIRKMIAAAGVNQDDTVIEIGPGFGILTFALAHAAKQVYAFEIEKKLEQYWEEKQQAHTNLQIIWGNALHHLEDFVQENMNGDYKVVANLPYQITSHAIRTILSNTQKPSDVVIMIQKEVAERICAKPGDMSLLSVVVQYYGTPRMVDKVARGCFWPVPGVDSALLHIQIDPQQSFDDEDMFFRLVKAGFSNKRKQLWRNLSVGLGIEKLLVQEMLKDICGNEKVRAEVLSIAQWKCLLDALEAT